MLHECRTAEEVRELARVQSAKHREMFNAPRLEPEPVKPEPIPEPEPVIEVVMAPPEEINVENFNPDCTIPDEPPLKKYPTIARIIEVVCRRFDVAKIDLISARRTQKIVVPRQIVMYLARNCTLQTLPFIGLHLGGRDHTTIISGLKKIERVRAADPAFDAMLKELVGEVSVP